MTIEEHIKIAMKDCPLTHQQEGQLLIGLKNYLDEINPICEHKRTYYVSGVFGGIYCQYCDKKVD